MPLWESLLDAAGLLLVLILGYGLALVVRRRLLARNGGTFELSFRARTGRSGRGWLLGLGRYSGGTLEWFRIFSLSPRPTTSWRRRQLTYESRRDPEGVEAVVLYPGHVVIECDTAVGMIELAMSAASLTGFQAWLEAAPPGVDWTT